MDRLSIPIRVLLVEDSEDDAIILLNELRRSGYSPTFERIETLEALRAALTQHAWDVILADQALPHCDALGALGVMRQLGLDLPFIVVSGTINEAMAVDVLKAGAHDFILKGNWARLGPALARELREAEERRQRQRAEDALLANEKWYRALIEHSPDAIWLLGVDHRLEYVSPSTTRILGYASEAVLSLDPLDLIHPDDRAEIHALLGQLHQTPYQLITQQYRVRHRDGAWRWVEATFNNLLAEPSVAAIVINYRDVTERRQDEDRLRLMDEVLQRIQSLVVLADEWGAVTFISEASHAILGYSPAELRGDRWWQAIYDDPAEAEADRARVARIARGELLPGHEPYEQAIKTRAGQTRWLLWQVARGPDRTLIAIGHDITERKRAEAELRLQGAALAAAANAIVITDRQGTITWINPAFTQLTGYAAEEAVGSSPRLLNSGYHDQAFYQQLWETVLAGWVWHGELVNRRKDGCLYHEEQTITPVLDENGAVRHFIAIKQDISDRKQAEEQTRTQLRRLAALRNIDLAIAGGLDRDLVLDIFLEEALAQLQADAAAVLLYNATTHYLEQPIRRGFRTPALQHTRLHLGQGLAGRAALERRPVSIADLATEPDWLAQSPQLAAEGFVAYQGVPLIAKGHIKGVLEVFQRKPFTPSDDWLDYVAVLAGQAAIAIDNAELFVTLQRSSEELAVAYDATIEGWSRALDLRDHDTEGHTQRVTELTLRLARALGVTEAELVHIRRGALLHDIGKLAVSDSILLKPGPLTEPEMALMRQHPVFAFRLLSPIGYLGLALDIPYCHHEKWDGTGYPRGLSGEAIPLSARIFAVVDVWDALRSTRPYRPAWPADRVREYIRLSAGTHFDPQIAQAFLQLDRLS